MLDHFMLINMPYGIVRNSRKEWATFNREYMPLGVTGGVDAKASVETGTNDAFPHLYTRYYGLHENLLLKLSDGRVSRNDNGEIIKIWFYNDRTNPCYRSNANYQENWKNYCEKLELLAAIPVLTFDLKIDLLYNAPYRRMLHKRLELPDTPTTYPEFVALKKSFGRSHDHLKQYF